MFLAFFVAVFGPLILYALFKYAKAREFSKYVDKLPGPKKYPFIGTIWLFFGVKMDDTYRLRRKITSQYKPLFRTWNCLTPDVHIMKPEHLEIVMNNTTHITKANVYDVLKPWLGTGLLTSDGIKWHKHRKLLTPTFHFQILENFMDVFAEKSQKLVKQLSNYADGNAFDIYPIITSCALDIISETAMGVQINAMDGKNWDYVQAVYGMCRLTQERIMKPWLGYDFIYRLTERGKMHYQHLELLHTFTNNVIQDRKRKIAVEKDMSGNEDTCEFGTKRRKAFLDILLEGGKLTDTDIREEVDTFMFEGHDTTTAAINFALLLLGNHPDIQDKVYEELLDVFGENGEGPKTIAEVNQLQLLERVVKETLRLYPSVPIIIRTLAQDIQLDEYKIPAGVMSFLHIIDVHLDEKTYPDPEKFDPDRFLPEATCGRHPFAYIPFSAGPRNCIGQKFAMIEEKTVLAYLLKKYKVTALENRKTLELRSELILRPKNGLQVILEPR